MTLRHNGTFATAKDSSEDCEFYLSVITIFIYEKTVKPVFSLQVFISVPKLKNIIRYIN